MSSISSVSSPSVFGMVFSAVIFMLPFAFAEFRNQLLEVRLAELCQWEVRRCIFTRVSRKTMADDLSQPFHHPLSYLRYCLSFMEPLVVCPLHEQFISCYESIN